MTLRDDGCPTSFSMDTNRNILTKRQLVFLECIAREPLLRGQFYLTSGTALAGFYLHHRLSEDLDFFSEREVDPQGCSK